MKRFFAALLLAIVSCVSVAQVPIYTRPSGVTQTAISTSGGVVTLSKSAIPFIHVSSGNIGNNGALTAITALTPVYSNGAYVYYPTNAIAAGVAAGWYWTVFSSTTAGTIYNSTYTTGTPVLGTTTAFATTGPGAFTGDTTERAGPTIAVPANSLGINGGFRIQHFWQFNNTAGAKTMGFRYSGAAGTTFTTALTTQVSAQIVTLLNNEGATNVQKGRASVVMGSSAVSFMGRTVAGVDTTAATSIVFSLTKAVATDNLVLEDYSIEQFYAQ